MAELLLLGFEFRPTRPPATRTSPSPSSVALLPMRHADVMVQAASPPVAADH
jgi:hypothetical protein